MIPCIVLGDELYNALPEYFSLDSQLHPHQKKNVNYFLAASFQLLTLLPKGEILSCCQNVNDKAQQLL